MVQVYWGRVSDGTTLTVNNAEDSSLLLSEKQYTIGNFTPLDQVSAMVIAVLYVGSKSQGVEVAKGETFGKGSKLCITKFTHCTVCVELLHASPY